VENAISGKCQSVREANQWNMPVGGKDQRGRLPLRANHYNQGGAGWGGGSGGERRGVTERGRKNWRTVGLGGSSRAVSGRRWDCEDGG
jgi:hypothetical protein